MSIRVYWKSWTGEVSAVTRMYYVMLHKPDQEQARLMHRIRPKQLLYHLDSFAIVGALAFLTIGGFYMFGRSNADINDASVEAELGTVEGGAQIIDDETAGNGQVVRFGPVPQPVQTLRDGTGSQ